MADTDVTKYLRTGGVYAFSCPKPGISVVIHIGLGLSHIVSVCLMMLKINAQYETLKAS